jgi:hypothetical protein
MNSEGVVVRCGLCSTVVALATEGASTSWWIWLARHSGEVHGDIPLAPLFEPRR